MIFCALHRAKKLKNWPFFDEIGVLVYFVLIYLGQNIPLQQNKNRKYMGKLKLLRVGALLLVSSLWSQAYAQTPGSISMSLDECLEYAKENSITLQKAQVQIENSQAYELSAKSAFLPTVSGSVNQGLSSYPLNDDSSMNYTGSYGLDLSLSLYSGGKNRAQLQQSVIDEQISSLAFSEMENSLEVSITEIYVEILYAIEQIKVAESSLEVSEKSQARGAAFLEAGSINEADYAQLESNVASYKYSVVVAQTQLSSLYVALKYLLEISQDVTFEVKEPSLSDDLLLSQIPSVADVYGEALESRPEIQSSELSIQTAELDVTVAKAGYLPTISLSAGTGLSHASTSSYDFSSQLRNNFNTSVGVNVSIPIFSGYRNKSAVTIAENSVKTASLSLSQAQKDLYQTIETLRNNAANSQAKYSVSEYALKASQKSVDLVTEQFDAGMKTILELLTEQDNYTQTYQEHLTNKYQLILNKALLNYYKTDIIKL